MVGKNPLWVATSTSDGWRLLLTRSNDKRQTRLNISSHLLERIPYKEVPREKVKLPKRRRRSWSE
jgi:polyphosphate kinase